MDMNKLSLVIQSISPVQSSIPVHNPVQRLDTTVIAGRNTSIIKYMHLFFGCMLIVKYGMVIYMLVVFHYTV